MRVLSLLIFEILFWVPFTFCADPEPSIQPICKELNGLRLCITLHTQNANFSNADVICKKSGLDVVTVPTIALQQFILDTIKQQASSSLYWIGLRKMHHFFRWQSKYHSIPATFFKEPPHQLTDFCVVINPASPADSSWEARPCKEEHAFICGSLQEMQTHSEDIDIKLNTFKCPPDFILLHRQCYLIAMEPENLKTWDEANKACETKFAGAQLASITSSHTQDRLISLLAGRPVPTWIGLKVTNRQVHSWLRQEAVLFTNWGVDQPNGGSLTQCTSMTNDGEEPGFWNDEDCSIKHGYICDVKPTVVEASSGNSGHMMDFLFSKGRCADGFYEYRSSCVSLTLPLQKRVNKPVSDAVTQLCANINRKSGTSDMCSKRLGTVDCPIVMSPHNAAETAYQRTLVHQFGSEYAAAWVGLKVTREGVYMDAGGLMESTFLLNLSIRDKAQQLNDEVSLCLALKKDENYLSEVRCEDDLPTICGYFLDDHPLHLDKPKSSQISCPQDLFAKGDFCYSRPSPMKLSSWDGAERECRLMGGTFSPAMNTSYSGHLASIHDANMIASFVASSVKTPVWIGLHTQEMSDHDTISWTDESPVNYIPFESNQLPALSVDYKACGQVSLTSHLVSMAACETKLPFICQFPLAAFQVVKDVSGEGVDGCPKGFLLEDKENGVCYKVSLDSTYSFAANEACRSLFPTAQLASIHSRAAELKLASLLDPRTEYWIGLSQSGLTYSWTDRSVVKYVREDRRSLDSHRWSFYDCYSFTAEPKTGSDPLWKADNCLEKKHFVCQVYLKDKEPLMVKNESVAAKNLPRLKCPLGYVQYEDRCFMLINNKTSFDFAEQECSKSVNKSPGFVGSLVRISNARQNDFVSALLAASVVSSSGGPAWIGLRIGSTKWTDGSPVDYTRLSKNVVVADYGNQDSLCTAIFSSDNLHFHGSWIQIPCDSTVQSAMLCQATPTGNDSSLAASPSSANKVQDRFACPPGFSVGLYNRSDTAPAPPVCLKLASVESKEWKLAKEECESHQAELVFLRSASDWSFVRAWLQTPVSLGGPGLKSEELVWLGLKVPDCPDCFRDWHWSTNPPRPVQVTDWLESPDHPSGCYAFHVSSLFPEQFVRSMRPLNCSEKRPVVCQTSATSLEIQGHETVARSHRQPVCLLDANNSITYRTDVSLTKTGRACVRWDLVKIDIKKQNRRPFHWQTGRNYEGNNCAFQPSKTAAKFACYTSTDASSLEDCELQTCILGEEEEPISIGWILTYAMLAIVFITIVGLLTGFFVKRRSPHLTGYHRQYGAPFTLSGNLSASREAVFGMPGYRRNFFNSIAPIRRFDTSSASMITTAPVSSTTFKNPLYRPLFDAALEEPDNADEFNRPV